MYRLFVASVLFVCAFAAPQSRTNFPTLDGRIVGGETVNIEDYPYSVSLLYYRNHICGGSIISPTIVITAGHCTYGSPASSITVRAGSSFYNSGGVVVVVARITHHLRYNQYTADYDISILALGTPFTFSSTIAAVGLPYQDQDIAAGSLSVVSGWGTLTEGGSLPSQLQAVQLPIVSLDVCRNAYGATAITDRMLCAGFTEGGKDSCQGDSGGPLVVNGLLFGIVSWGNGCARPSYPGVYASVPNLRTFITESSGI